jgi:hypothetical protein
MLAAPLAPYPHSHSSHHHSSPVRPYPLTLSTLRTPSHFSHPILSPFTTYPFLSRLPRLSLPTLIPPTLSTLPITSHLSRPHSSLRYPV